MSDVGSQVMPAGLSFRRLALIGKRQWWVVLGCVMLAALGSVGYVKTRTITYTVTATVAVASQFTPAPTSTGATAVTGVPLTGTLDPTTELASPSVIAAAAAAGGLLPTAVRLSATVSGSLVAITASGRTAEQAALVANAAAAAFVTQRLRDVTAAVASLNPQLKSLSDQITKLRANIPAQTSGSTPSADQDALVVVQAQYQTLYNQRETVSQAASSVSVSAQALASQAFGSGGGKRTVEVALVAGLLDGLGIALAREQFDNRIRSVSELGEVSSAEVLAELPVSDLGSRSATIADKPFGEMAESVRELRTALRFLSVKRPVRTILVASAGANEGRSFVATNLAVAWAMSGVRTVLVSSDLRKPSLERNLLAAEAHRGLSEAIVDAALLGHHRDVSGISYLQEADDIAISASFGTRPLTLAGEPSDEVMRDDPAFDIDDLLVPTRVDGLMLLPSGPSPPNPAELLGSPELSKLLISLRERAEVIVMDSPPVLAVTDALVLTAQVDSVLFVVSMNRTSRSAAKRALRQLESGLAPVLGIVINRSPRSQSARY